MTKPAPTSTKALDAALKRRELMLATGASPESLEVMNRRIAKLSAQPAAPQPVEEQDSFSVALARFVAAANLTVKAA